MQFDHLFPTVIGVDKYSRHTKIQNNLVKFCLNKKTKIQSGGKNWMSKETYNTSTTYNLTFEPLFQDLNKWVYSQVIKYCQHMNYVVELTCSGVWFNVYEKNDYQEYHRHAKDCISAIYILKGNKKAAKTYFRSPILETAQEPKIKINNFNTFIQKYEALPGRLLMFKSNTEHAVEKHLDNNQRITLAYNFRLK
tara:strand:- start:817 stop:1398 length:582 start_codon:yes stop_codon:yes gene_type:complete